MIVFHVLGTLDLRGPEGTHLASPLSGAKRLGLFAYLALGAPGGLHRRDTLVGLFWPESNQKRARNALSNMLYQIRRHLGRDVLVTRGQEEVGLNEGVLWCDALAFLAALHEERLEEALELYRGDLLEGFFVPGGSAEFERWLEQERMHLRGRAAEAANSLVEKVQAKGDVNRAIRWARRSVELDPYDERAARRLIELLDGAGDRASALQVYERLALLLDREFQAEPSAETRAMLERVRARDRPRDTGLADRDEGEGASKRPSSRSVAVLPFENLSGNPEVEPIAAGLHADLLTELSRISELHVIARNSVLRYRNEGRPVQEIARELGVGTLVEAAVQVVEGHLRLNLEVIDAWTSGPRWAERYDRELSAEGIFELQGELSRDIAERLHAELTAGERIRAAAQQPTADMEAYRLCVQGRALLDQRTPRAMYRSIDYFQRAIERDSHYALAWSGLADSLSLLEYYDHSAPPTAPDPLKAAQRAVELGPELGQARASLGIIYSIRGEGTKGLAELQVAVHLAPSYAEAHAWLGWVHLLRGRPDDAFAAERQAVELDPLSPVFRAFLSEAHLASGRTREALREAIHARQIQPEYGLVHFMEGLALYHAGRLKDSSAALERALGLVPPWGTPSHAEVHAALAVVDAAAGDREAARARLTQIDKSAHPFSYGLVLAALGDAGEAMAQFERVREWSSFSIDHFRYFFPRVLGPIRKHPRWRALRREIDRTWH